MEQRVVIFECDNCPETGVPEELDMSNPLPQGWSEVSARNNHGMQCELQLCTRCMMALGNALGERNVPK
jgi:hypothetical protein